MKQILLVLMATVMLGCQSTKINNIKFLSTASVVELGAIGAPSKSTLLKNEFSIRAIPYIQNKVRLDVRILPFTKQLYKTYMEKTAEAQLKPSIIYADSIPNKPRLAVINILDKNSLADELNALHNKSAFTYLKNSANTALISGIAVTVSDDNLSRILDADTYYLQTTQDDRSLIVLYKDGKRTGIVDVQAGIILGYTYSTFCWSLDRRNEWYIADIADMGSKCQGLTKSKLKKKQEDNLFKM